MTWEPDYVTLDEYKDWAGITETDTVDDIRLARDITAASRAVDAFCSQETRRQFGKVATSESRYYTPRWDVDMAQWVIEIDDVHSATGLTLAVDPSNDGNHTQAITDFILRPRDALANMRVFTQIAVKAGSSVQPYMWPDSAKVTTDKWGWSTPPVAVVEATFLQTNRYQSRRDSPYGVAGSPAKGNTTSIQAKLDIDFEGLLQNYVKRGWTMWTSRT